MVLEGLIKPFAAERKPYELLFFGFAFSSIAIVLSMFIFSPHSSIVAIALTAIVCIPIIYGVIKMEERKSMEIMEESLLVKEHGRALMFFLFLFLGFALSFAAWYIFLPEPHISEVFQVQMSTITGFEDVTGKMTGLGSVSELFSHNFRVLMFCLLFAFFYGFGAIFILTWNASVVGAVIGDAVRSNISNGFMSIISSSLLRYLVHGIPEILAYFTAGLAGGIISIAVINHDWKSKKFTHVLMDSAELILISVALLVAAAVLEVYVSPFV